MTDLQDTSNAQVVLIVGASSGIGLATARAFAGRGAHLVLVSRSRPTLEAAAAQCRAAGAGSVRVAPADARDATAIAGIVSDLVDDHGRIDVVVHTATVMAYGQLEELPQDVFTAVVDTAVTGTLVVGQASIGLFRKQKRGTLIVVNSLVGAIVAPSMGAYATAKWAQAAMLRTWQLETRDAPRIRVCSVVPGGVDTPIYYQAANYTGTAARPPIPVDPPEKVAAAILRCADHPRDRISVGLANPITILGFRLLPKVYSALVGPLFRVGALTKTTLAPTAGNVHEPLPDSEGEHGRWPRRWDISRH
ncbi:SDR family NAD(P)-dependent oxidoreductase [Jatrophihabitans telluris]|uniref:SDR family NAD(P)-dependent oxidoreductase n=1 Tax=Jatrophihabitans telluris TaxID=2038343 RepID=A0ABY4QY45_9ACTN|nr:SDR family NAD(P)-dependent oxidoreductase [Jatrophihabitans telluris]UQX88430.1 SDR family NAD(P)-dependent oxidoreductase [Jatrophihabitans telluris]